MSHFLTNQYFSFYIKKQPYTVEKHLRKLSKKVFTEKMFEATIAGSAVYSSMIEGNPIDVNSYFKYLD